MEIKNMRPPAKRATITLMLLLLAVVYVFQQFDYFSAMMGWIGMSDTIRQDTAFIFNKTLRLIMNDLLCFGLIWLLFGERKYVRIAFIVFCIELFFVLPVYLFVKLRWEGTSEISSPFLSQIHRLIVNPMLMLILIAGFIYQRNWAPRHS